MKRIINVGGNLDLHLTKRNQNVLKILKQGEESSAFRFYIIMNIAMVLELAIEY